jgi:hypothetical protein
MALVVTVPEARRRIQGLENVPMEKRRKKTPCCLNICIQIKDL